MQGDSRLTGCDVSYIEASAVFSEPVELEPVV